MSIMIAMPNPQFYSFLLWTFEKKAYALKPYGLSVVAVGKPNTELNKNAFQ